MYVYTCSLSKQTMYITLVNIIACFKTSDNNQISYVHIYIGIYHLMTLLHLLEVTVQSY